MATKTFEQLPAITTTASADKLPIWDDSGAIAAHITIANFEADVINGAGFVKADGTIPMTGDLDLASTEITSNDTDTTHLLGRAFVGDPGTVDYAAFGHRHFVSTTTCAMHQSPTGDTTLQANTGGLIFFDIGGTTELSLSPTTFDLNSIKVSSDDADQDFTFGRGSIGTPAGGGSDQFYIGHRDHWSATAFAMRVTNAGQTVLNAASGQKMFFTVANVTKATMDTTSLDLLALTTASNDADTGHTFGRVRMGYDGTNADYAVWSHRDHHTSTNYAMFQNWAGGTQVNAASGQGVTLSVNNSPYLVLASTGDIGVWTAVPECQLHVMGTGISGQTLPGNTFFKIENNSDTFMQIEGSNSGEVGIYFADSDGASVGQMKYIHSDNRFLFTTDGTPRVEIHANEMAPQSDGAYDCGQSGARWQDVWASNGMIQTSDITRKDSIEVSDLGLAFINELRPVSFRWKSTKERRERKKEHNRSQKARKHYGLVAQDVKATLDKLNISTDDFAAYIEGDTESGDVQYSLRYTEFMGPMIKAIQELSEKVTDLEGNLNV